MQLFLEVDNTDLQWPFYIYLFLKIKLLQSIILLHENQSIIFCNFHVLKVRKIKTIFTLTLVLIKIFFRQYKTVLQHNYLH